METAPTDKVTSREQPNPWLAVALSIGFYALTVGVCLVLVAIPVVLFVVRGRPHGVITLGCLAAVYAIAKAAWPEREQFVTPGVPIELDAHPGLAKLVREVAARAQEPVPPELYLTGDVNAFVSQRGGFLGLSGRRYMGLGIPLLQALDRAELRAVLAHELGHYSGGDTRVSGWVYRARRAVFRTLAALEERNSSFLRKPFAWYGRTFMRITYAISRGQEYAADRMAARVAGTAAAISALRKVRVTSELFDQFWHTRAQPAVAVGLAPPVYQAFASSRLHLLEGERGQARLLAVSDSEESTDPLDTHPPMSDRIAALEQDAFVESTPGDNDAGRAIDLLQLDAALLTRVLQHEAAMSGALHAADWIEAARKAYLPRWRKQCAHYASVVSGKTLGEVIASEATLQAFARKVLSREHDTELEDDAVVEDPMRFVRVPLRNLVMVAACEAGYEPTFDETLSRGLTKNGVAIEVDMLFEDDQAPESHRSLEALGLAGLSLTLEPTLQDLLEPEPTDNSSGVGQIYATILRACQKGRKESTATYRLLVRRFYTLPEPAWIHGIAAPEQAAMRTALERQRKALVKGTRVCWGRIYIANKLLFEPGDVDSPCVVLYSPDPHFDDRPALLGAIQSNIAALVSGDLRLETPAARLLQERLGSDDFVPGRLDVPRELSYGHVVYVEPIILHRHLLMGGFLLYPWFPIVIAEDGAISIQTLVEWPKRLLDLWSDAVDEYVEQAKAQRS